MTDARPSIAAAPEIYAVVHRRSAAPRQKRPGARDNAGNPFGTVAPGPRPGASRGHPRPVRSPGSGQGETLAGAATAAAPGLRHRRGCGEPSSAPRASRTGPVVGYAVGTRHAIHGRGSSAGRLPHAGRCGTACQGHHGVNPEPPAMRMVGTWRATPAAARGPLLRAVALSARNGSCIGAGQFPIGQLNTVEFRTQYTQARAREPVAMSAIRARARTGGGGLCGAS